MLYLNFDYEKPVKKLKDHPSRFPYSCLFLFIIPIQAKGNYKYLISPAALLERNAKCPSISCEMPFFPIHFGTVPFFLLRNIHS